MGALDENMPGWRWGPMLEVVEKYMESVKKYPNPHAPDLTNFKGR